MLQQWPKLSNNADTFKMEDSVDQIRAFRRAEDGRDEVGSLGDNFVTSHGIFWRSTNVVDPLSEVRAIRQRNVDDGHAQRHQTLQLGIWNELHLGPFSKNRGVFQALLVMR